MSLMSITRRSLAAAVLAAALPLSAAQAFEVGNPECIAPAAPGGGWDFTCRQAGKAMYDLKLVPSPMQVTNMTGGSGGVAYANVVAKRASDKNLIVAASSSTSARLAQGAYPGMNKDQVKWLGSIGADYGIIAVAKDSPVNTLPELIEKLKADPASVAVAGGSAVGGWDHLKVLNAARKAGVSNLRQIKYVPFEGGGEAITQLLGGHVQAFTGDISEAKGFVDSGDIKILAVLAPERLPGDFGKFPTAREQGIDAIGANWRGFYGPGNMPKEAYDYWVSTIDSLYKSDEWQQIMAANGLMPLDLQGDEFEAFVAEQIKDTEELSREIGLIK
ncbi:MAG: tripartite tricarboxylate transporter substrate binding protein [Caenispirillum sp.]|nr:tripartite tricarboxylate transporter substrate binding protein [Caenispirillum sp.]